jgi:hypothetical protein
VKKRKEKEEKEGDEMKGKKGREKNISNNAITSMWLNRKNGSEGWGTYRHNNRAKIP